MITSEKNLTLEPPRSPRSRLGGYALMARMIDKGRATVDGLAGEYHYACPLDQQLFQFKGVESGAVREQLASGASDEQIVAWFDTHGIARTPEEIEAWSTQVENYRPYNNPEQRDWISEECARLGLDPRKTSLTDYLEADDDASFKN